jgi:hypothetical protein
MDDLIDIHHIRNGVVRMSAADAQAAIISWPSVYSMKPWPAKYDGGGRVVWSGTFPSSISAPWERIERVHER